MKESEDRKKCSDNTRPKHHDFVEPLQGAPVHIVVDMLYDFIDGTMACKHSEEAVSEVVKYINAHPEQRVVYVTDAHPVDHCSFLEQGGIWPSHCVQGTHGADIHEKFYKDVVDSANRPDRQRNIYRKGTMQDKEQYSGFEAVNAFGTMLKDDVPEEIIISGIATEYCVKNTLMDFLNDGHKIQLLLSGLAYVDEAGHEETIKELRSLVSVVE